MRFRVGAIPESPGFLPSTDWQQLREPSPILLQIISIPVAVATAAVLIMAWSPFVTVSELFEWHVAHFLMFIAALVVVHEFLHASVHPRFGFTETTIIGLWPARGLFYAHYLGEISRTRFLAVFSMPLVVLTVMPLAFACLTGSAASWAALASLANGVFACGDIVCIGLVAGQVPTNAICRNQGWKTYWRLPIEDNAGDTSR